MNEQQCKELGKKIDQARELAAWIESLEATIAKAKELDDYRFNVHCSIYWSGSCHDKRIYDLFAYTNPTMREAAIRVLNETLAEKRAALEAL